MQHSDHRRFTVMNRKRTFLFTATLLCAMAASAAAQDTYTLRYRFDGSTPIPYLRTETTDALSQTQDGRTASIRRTTEARIRVTPEASDAQSVRFIFEQDTAVVRDSSTRDASADDIPDFENLLTRRPVRVTMTPLGQLRQAQPLVSITEGRTLPPSMTDGMLARQAMIFPTLPDRTLRIGESWTDAKADTLHPEQRSDEYGMGSGLRLLRVATTYRADTLERVGGRQCLRISLTGRAMIETKMIFRAHEFFTEEATNVSGMLWFDPAAGMIVKLHVHTERDATSAAFSKDVAIIPSTTVKDITLTLLPS